MKRLLTFLTSLPLLFSCSYNEPIPDMHDNMNPTSITVEGLRTPDEAIAIAENALNLISDVSAPHSRKGSIRKVDYTLQAKVIGSRIQKSRTATADTLMYVINYTDSMGFALVSALRNTPELLAVTISGSYDSAVPVDNPGFNMYMERTTNYLSYMATQPQSSASGGDRFILDPRKPMPLDSIAVDTLWTNNTPNRVKVYWGQEGWFGDDCPNKKAGCSNTAVAMLMTHFRKPQSLQLTYEEYKDTRPFITLDWDELTKHYSFQSYPWDYCNNPSYPIHKRISQLCRELGHRSNSSYNPGETPTPIANTMSVLRSFGYNVRRFEWAFRGIEEDLSSQTILLMYGTNSNTNKAHMWLCDAAKCYKCQYRHYQVDPRTIIKGDFNWRANLPWELVSEWQSECTLLYFYNWGWASKDLCGYFHESNFKVADRNYNLNVGYLKVSI